MAEATKSREMKAIYTVPGGLIRGRIIERYEGLRGQIRIALVDSVGRVYHYDIDEVRVLREIESKVGEESE